MAAVERRTWQYAGVAAGMGVLFLVGALWFGGGRPQPGLPGLPDPGLLTGWGLPLVRLAGDLCSIATVGTLVAGVVLAPRGSRESNACVRAAGRWALAWVLCTIAAYLLTISNIVALPVPELLADLSAFRFAMAFPQSQALLIVVLWVAVVALGAWHGRNRRSGVLLVIAALGLLPPIFAGHAVSAGDHDIAVSALTTHLLAAAVWVGGLAAVLVHFRRSERLGVVLPRFSTLALCCFVAVAVSGVAGAWVRLATVAQLWTTGYGVLILVKGVALVGLGIFGWLHRRRTVAGVAERSVRRTFVRLATGEAVVMIAAVGLAVGLSRTPPPAAGSHEGILDYSLAHYSAIHLITEIRLDPLILLALVAPAAGYLVGLRRLARAGVTWPAGRTVAWFAGLLALAVVLVGGVGGYARALMPAHALQYAVLGVVGPLLLACGAPLTLAARATSANSQYGDVATAVLDSRVARRLTRPGVVVIAHALPFGLLYGARLLELSVSDHVVHLLSMGLCLASGVLCCWVLAGVDPLPRPISWRARAWLLGAVAAVQAVVGLLLLAGPPLAEIWFALVSPPGAPDPVAAQRAGGVVYLTLPVVALAVLGVRLARLRRTDRRRVAHVVTPA
ncbi:cytochrome c oxidase assembly protein [Nonomuraea jiangxiensis]|uniref:Putative copper resistance protein D n=1 Tax=Nonomuraea jiangxiensis TaxID=633440 RepID=A0A1G9G5S0_9ACTN|nr:cytochrome c oxidase assembly protein [Nonomuraea jiangxiensis]SDK95952.1 putative copper resistance protein D [Nonomuraea jiangxiensis]